MKLLTLSRFALCVFCGASIFVVPGLASAGWVRQTSGTTKNLNAVQFPVDAQTGYIVGGSVSGGGNVILKTTDGGATWVPQVPPDTTLALWSLDFPVNADTGWVVGGSGSSCALFETTNGGAHWFYQDISSGILLGVDFPVDNQTGCVVGVGGMIAITTDGGSHWNYPSSGTSKRLYSVDFPADALTGYAVGDSGTVRKTTDGGATWFARDPGPNYDFYSVHFPVDAQTGYTVGWDGITYKTTNGGTDWVSQNPSVEVDLHSVYFPVDAFTGYAVGWPVQPNNIVKTTDGGAYWDTLTSGTNLNLNSVHFPGNVMTGYAVGDSGTILKTTDGGGVGVENGRDQGLGIRDQAYRAFPNPFTSYATLPGHEGERFTLYYISGRKVGTYRGDRIGEGLAPGVYFLRPSAGNARPVRVVKLR